MKLTGVLVGGLVLHYQWNLSILFMPLSKSISHTHHLWRQIGTFFLEGGGGGGGWGICHHLCRPKKLLCIFKCHNTNLSKWVNESHQYALNDKYSRFKYFQGYFEQAIGNTIIFCVTESSQTLGNWSKGFVLKLLGWRGLLLVHLMKCTWSGDKR